MRGGCHTAESDWQDRCFLDCHQCDVSEKKRPDSGLPHSGALPLPLPVALHRRERGAAAVRRVDSWPFRSLSDVRLDSTRRSRDLRQPSISSLIPPIMSAAGQKRTSSDGGACLWQGGRFRLGADLPGSPALIAIARSRMSEYYLQRDYGQTQKSAIHRL